MIIAFNSLKKNIFPATVGKIGNDGNFLVYLRLSRNFVGFYHNFSMENFLCDSFFIFQQWMLLYIVGTLRRMVWRSYCFLFSIALYSLGFYCL